MINSGNNDYYFLFKNGEKDIWGTLYDFKEMVIHEYEVINTKNGLEFKYLNSKKFGSITYFEKDIQYEFSHEIIDSVKSKSTLTKIHPTNRGKKKFRGKVELEYESNSDIFNANILKYFGHHFFDNRDISFVGYKLPTKITFDYNNGTAISTRLTKKQKINTTLTISKGQINFKK